MTADLRGTDRASGLTRSPALVVGLARIACIRHWRHLDLDIELLVALDGRLGSAAIFLAPDQRQYISHMHFGVDYSQGQRGAFVVAVATIEKPTTFPLSRILSYDEDE
jgi:hypothetical protein